MTSLLEVHGLVKQFGGHRAVDEASFAVEAGSITRLIGPNGAGKTTAFNCIAGFLGSDGGRVLFDGQEITGKPPHRIFGLGLTRTFQIPQELSSLSVLENLLLVPEGQTGEPLLRPWRERREEAVNVTRAKEVLALVELTPLMRDRAGSLSGGQQKLLELARALMSRPRMILLDEPGAGVNPTLARRLVSHIRRVRDELEVTFLLIEHDMDLVAELCDPVIVMANGQVLTQGSPSAVLASTTVQKAYLGSQYR